MRRGLATALAGIVLLGTTVLAFTPPASAGLLSGLLCPVTNTLGVTSAGWDDGATTPPTTLAQVDQAIGAAQLQSHGITGAGIGVAMIDSGVVPVEGLAGAGKVINGPDLSFEGNTGAPQYLDTYGHGTHLGGIIAGDDGTAGGFTGVAPGAHLVSLKVASHDGA